MSIYVDSANAIPKNDYQNQKRFASAKMITILNVKRLLNKSNDT
jgi:hypothetical protein